MFRVLEEGPSLSIEFSKKALILNLFCLLDPRTKQPLPVCFAAGTAYGSGCHSRFVVHAGHIGQ